MSEQIDMHEAKTRLAELLDRVEAGEEVIIVRDGRPVARLVPLRAASGAREPGRMRGKIRIGDDFDAPLGAGLLR
ncbi:MAG TPA: type II toxin-antitoxin system prevent-host-death family antitoxin [Thermoanaerobaculia bacterium]|jgi:prevent-host-death family protein